MTQSPRAPTTEPTRGRFERSWPTLKFLLLVLGTLGLLIVTALVFVLLSEGR